jgi:hypothetical protein
MTNPLLDKKTWDFADMAVAQDWELERGNEGALIWTDLGPEMARTLCEHPEIFNLLTSFTKFYIEPNSYVEAGVSGADRAWAGAGEGEWKTAMVYAGAMSVTTAWAWAGTRAWAWVRARRAYV